MTIIKIGAAFFFGTLAIACSSAEEEAVRGEAALRTNVTDSMTGRCSATQCIEVEATERLLYLSVEGTDCDGEKIWDFGLERRNTDGTFTALNLMPMWGESDETCIGKSEKMWHFHGLDVGVYRVCATFHDTATAGSLAVHAKSASGACTSQPYAGSCTYCDDDELGGFDPGSGAGGGEPSGTGGSEHAGGEGGCDE